MHAALGGNMFPGLMSRRTEPVACSYSSFLAMCVRACKRLGALYSLDPLLFAGYDVWLGD